MKFLLFVALLSVICFLLYLGQTNAIYSSCLLGVSVDDKSKEIQCGDYSWTGIRWMIIKGADKELCNELGWDLGKSRRFRTSDLRFAPEEIKKICGNLEGKRIVIKQLESSNIRHLACFGSNSEITIAIWVVDI